MSARQSEHPRTDYTSPEPPGPRSPSPGQSRLEPAGVIRQIVHIDMDAFYASVEVRDHPELWGRPVAVAHLGKRGVVLTANYEARAFGVRSAMPTQMALDRCPELLLTPPRMEVYHEVSGVIREIFLRYTDLVEPLSLDEAYLDVSAPKLGPPSGTLIAQAIKTDILRDTGLTASAGVSHTKFLAKIASDMNKPDGLTVIRPHEAQDIIDALPITAFHGVGPATALRMREHGVGIGADLRAWFGQQGEHYFRISHGIDVRPVVPDRERKSLGVERTYDTDLRGLEAVRGALPEITGLLLERLTRSKYVGRTLILKLKFADRAIVTRRVRCALPLTQADRILALATGLLSEEVVRGRRVRLVGLSVTGPVGADDPAQPGLFAAEDEPQSGAE